MIIYKSSNMNEKLNHLTVQLFNKYLTLFEYYFNIYIEIMVNISSVKCCLRMDIA